ncbi:MAG: alcohol dehydrogenase catalytic domain-containing protein [Bryobacteraceae bacterium]
MRAIVKTTAEPSGLALLDWKEPVPEPGQVKMKVTGAGICGTDIHIIRGTWISRPPVVLGHEWCGEIVETGAGVTHLKPGDRVTASNPARTCGHCYYCTAGNPFHCADRVSAGYMIDGALQSMMAPRRSMARGDPRRPQGSSLTPAR